MSSFSIMDCAMRLNLVAAYSALTAIASIASAVGLTFIQATQLKMQSPAQQSRPQSFLRVPFPRSRSSHPLINFAVVLALRTDPAKVKVLSLSLARHGGKSDLD